MSSNVYELQKATASDMVDTNRVYMARDDAAPMDLGVPLSLIAPQVVEATNYVELGPLASDTTVLVAPSAPLTLEVFNRLPAGRVLTIINKNPQHKVTVDLAGNAGASSFYGVLRVVFGASDSYGVELHASTQGLTRVGDLFVVSTALAFLEALAVAGDRSIWVAKGLTVSQALISKGAGVALVYGAPIKLTTESVGGNGVLKFYNDIELFSVIEVTFSPVIYFAKLLHSGSAPVWNGEGYYEVLEGGGAPIGLVRKQWQANGWEVLLDKWTVTKGTLSKNVSVSSSGLVTISALFTDATGWSGGVGVTAIILATIPTNIRPPRVVAGSAVATNGAWEGFGDSPSVVGAWIRTDGYLYVEFNGAFKECAVSFTYQI